METLILGKLGDLVKKATELKLLKQKDNKNFLLDIDLQAYEVAIEEWRMASSISYLDFISFRTALEQNIAKLGSDEEYLRKEVGLKDRDMAWLALVEYLATLKKIREILAKLNRVGGAGFVSGVHQDSNQMELEFTT